jgi:S1-C subfamily serine protease
MSSSNLNPEKTPYFARMLASYGFTVNSGGIVGSSSSTTNSSVSPLTINALSSSALIYANAINSLVTILTKDSRGSFSIGVGFFVSLPGAPAGYGYLATANHVITDYTRPGLPVATDVWIHITHPTNSIVKLNGTTNCVIGRDILSDVALLRIQGTFPALTYANSRTELACGDNVTVIGYPEGFDAQSVTRGVVRDNKAVPDVYFSGVGGGFMESVLTDCSIYGGNSGGPMINDDGCWIGILSWGVGSDSNLNGGVCSYLAQTLFLNWITNFTSTPLQYNKGYLGVNVQPMDLLLSVVRNLPNVQGYLVTGIDSSITPAKFNVGDIILSINGVDVGMLNNHYSLFTEVLLKTPGSSVSVTYRPAGNLNSILTKSVVIAAFPAGKDQIFSGFLSQLQQLEKEKRTEKLALSEGLPA